MAKSFLITTLTASALVFQALISIAWCHGSSGVGLSQRNISSGDVDLVSYLNSRTKHQDEIFTEAAHLLERMNSSPSCNRIAASKLVSTCQSIGGKSDSMDTDTYVVLENARSLYAARLAICEINGAGIPIPTTCLPVSIALPRKRNIFGFSSHTNSPPNTLDTTAVEILEPCLKSLESRPQWWTSYSNSRQNAVVICQASRIEGEREELLELYRSIIESSVKLSHGLQEALRTASTASNQHRDFIQATNAMIAALTQEMEVTQSRFKSTLENIVDDVGSGILSMVTTVKSAFGDIHTNMTALGEDVQNASHKTRQLQDTLGTIHSETVERDREMMALHKQNSITHRDLASSLHRTLDTVLHVDMTGLSQRVETVDSSLVEWLTGRFMSLLQHEQILAERLRDMEKSLNISQLKANDLHKAQVEQLKTIKAQSRLQDALQTSMRNSQVLLAKSTSAAANLEAMVDGTAAKFKESLLLSIGGLFSTSLWTISGALLKHIGAQNPRLVMRMLLIVGIFYFIMTLAFRYNTWSA